ncbi:MAG TPA: hypothetical protein DDW94_03535 [Deltaproteobacteria bacterium]|nr:MAG: hypothetical protein A2Z79_10230 [Deltaproteobacteria bacterium GWA2_55_82]OGQ62989.1 MAG: hypothetical protein A3I81_06740 [Deltaproteobacteria bacterium RIFCSPLOWO2_02_FULL_55_12]OIJ72953.1 MAG: hypothetical protein A2V21_300975 [Deltaproteobacteria bacterium GWC2_55_46]HBG46041.1 hypothetical protein [Deltaproteobacteria bacterium]HCY11741.1 hypothetical protein [Deltaproteobacteria bacterium]
MLSWYLVYTKPKYEDNVDTLLTNAGFEVLNPKIVERRYQRNKAAEVISPLFPCYIFARFDKMREYHLVKYTRGVKWVLRNENGPAEINDDVVKSIRGRIEDGVITIRKVFSPGQELVVNGGPFEGLPAIFEREMTGMERVSILLKSINVRVVIDRCMITAC